MSILGINGRINHGKDTVGSIIQYLTSYPNSKDRSYNSFIMDVGMGWNPSWQIKKFAGKLKEIASILTGIDIEKFEDQEFKKTYLPQEWSDNGMPITIRTFLQRLGTDSMRDNLHQNVWVNALFNNYFCQNCGWIERQEHTINDCNNHFLPNWVITDTRFINEAKAIKAKGGLVIRVIRNTPIPENEHISEKSLDSWQFDYIIENNGTIDELIEKVRQMLIKFNIL